MTTLSHNCYNGSAFDSTLPADAPIPSYLKEFGAEALETLFEAIVNEYHDDDESVISHILTDVNDGSSYMSWSEFYDGSNLGYDDDDTEWFHLYARNYGERVDVRSASLVSFLAAEQTAEERRAFALSVVG